MSNYINILKTTLMHSRKLALKLDDEWFYYNSKYKLPTKIIEKKNNE